MSIRLLFIVRVEVFVLRFPTLFLALMLAMPAMADGPSKSFDLDTFLKEYRRNGRAQARRDRWTNPDKHKRTKAERRVRQRARAHSRGEDVDLRPNIYIGTALPRTGAARPSLAQTTTSTLPALQKCYLDALRTTPELAGAVAMRFDIDASGRVGTIRTAGNLRGPLLDCLIDTVAAMRFAAEGAVTVDWPMAFAPELP